MPTTQPSVNQNLTLAFADAQKALVNAEKAAKKKDLKGAIVCWALYRYSVGFLAGLEEGGVRGFGPYRSGLDDMKFKAEDVRQRIESTFSIQIQAKS